LTLLSGPSAVGLFSLAVAVEDPPFPFCFPHSLLPFIILRRFVERFLVLTYSVSVNFGGVGVFWFLSFRDAMTVTLP